MEQIPIHISRGNMKMKINIFNLPTIETCKDGLECHSFCYAKKAEVQYPTTVASRQRNYDSSRSKHFVERVIEILKTRKNKIVRIHESGDFYSFGYIYSWFMIASLLPDYTFYAYSKRDDLFKSINWKHKPKNMTLIYSVDGIDSYNLTFKGYIHAKGNVSHVDVPAIFDKVAVVSSEASNCPAQLNKNAKCMEKCKMCLDEDSDFIIFKKH